MGVAPSAAGSLDWAAGLELPCRGGLAYNQGIAAISGEGSQAMGMLEEGSDVNTIDEAALPSHAPHLPRAVSPATTPQAAFCLSLRRNRPKSPGHCRVRR